MIGCLSITLLLGSIFATAMAWGGGYRGGDMGGFGPGAGFGGPNQGGGGYGIGMGGFGGGGGFGGAFSPNYNPFNGFGHHRHRHHFRNPFMHRWGFGGHQRHTRWRILTRSGNPYFYDPGMGGQLADFDRLPDKIRKQLGSNQQHFIEYGKSFGHRFNQDALGDIATNFNENYKQFQQLNNGGGKRRFELGWSPYMHLTSDEFKRILLPIHGESKKLNVNVKDDDGEGDTTTPETQTNPPEKDYQADVDYNDQGAFDQTTPQPVMRSTTLSWQQQHFVLPERFDWRDQITFPPARNQGYCGSCWAFSATGILENQVARKYNNAQVDLAEMDNTCVYNGTICDGGMPRNVFRYFKENPGIGLEVENRYNHSKPMICPDIRPVVRVSEVIDLLPFEMDKVKRALIINGPIAIGLHVTTTFQYYKQGIYDASCKGLKLGAHAITIIGYGVENSTSYWIARNSWGEKWGEKGYIKLQSGIDLCTIESWFMWQANIW